VAPRIADRREDGMNARKGVSILVTSSILASSMPTIAWADVALPPPPPKKSTPDLPPPPTKSTGSTPDLPPPPKKKSTGEGSAPKKSEGSSDGGGSSSGSSGAKSPERTTAIVLLVTGGVVTVGGTTMLLLGAGLKPSGKKVGGSNSGLLVAGGVTAAVGLTVATIGLVLLLKSNNGQLPPLKSLALDHPAVRTATWESVPTGPTAGENAFMVPWTATF
jgi:hypothetical protein